MTNPLKDLDLDFSLHKTWWQAIPMYGLLPAAMLAALIAPEAARQTYVRLATRGIRIRMRVRNGPWRDIGPASDFIDLEGMI